MFVLSETDKFAGVQLFLKVGMTIHNNTFKVLCEGLVTPDSIEMEIYTKL